MKLIMRSEYDNLRKNPLNQIEVDKNGDKQIVKIYFRDELIAKRVTVKKSIRYFGAANYNQFLTPE